MKAEKLIEETVKKEYQVKAHVIAHIPESNNWWHVHRDEEVPPNKLISVQIGLGQVEKPMAST